METYRLIKFFKADNEPCKVIQTGLTLEEVKAFCNREESHNLKQGWFIGWSKD